MGASPSINFFGVDLSTLDSKNLRKALHIFTRQPYPQLGLKPQSLREMQKMVLSKPSNTVRFYTHFLEMVRASMLANPEEVQVRFAEHFDEIILRFNEWYANPSVNVLFLGVSEVESEQKTNITETGYTLLVERHATAFIFKREVDQLVLTYFNSHSKKGTNHLGQQVSQHIRDNLHINVLSIFREEDVCPIFQTGFQGGNCSLWQLLILCLFMLNQQYIAEPNVIYKWIEKQNPPFLREKKSNSDYIIVLFEMFTWYKFGTYFPNFFQVLYNQAQSPRDLQISSLEDIYVRSYLNNKLAVTWCSGYSAENCPRHECIPLKNKCEYSQHTHATILELKDILQDLMQNLLNGAAAPPRINLLEEPAPVEPYRVKRYSQVQHYVCSLALDLITFLYCFNSTTTSLNVARIFSSSFQVNVQCVELLQMIFTIFKWPTFEECLDYVYEKPMDTSVLQYHCPTAAKLRYLLSGGISEREHLIVPPPNTCLYTNTTPYNITFSSKLLRLENYNLPVAVKPQHENAYNYVLFSNPDRLNYLETAMWDGFLKQMILCQPIQTKTVERLVAEVGEINYFPSLMVITEPPVVTPP